MRMLLLDAVLDVLILDAAVVLRLVVVLVFLPVDHY
jgi:hypothetical protein